MNLAGGIVLKIGPYDRAEAIKDAAHRLKTACSVILTAPMLLEDKVIDDDGGIHFKLASHLQELNDSLGAYLTEISPKDD